MEGEEEGGGRRKEERRRVDEEGRRGEERRGEEDERIDGEGFNEGEGESERDGRLFDVLLRASCGDPGCERSEHGFSSMESLKALLHYYLIYLIGGLIRSRQHE